jgi:hypothetical protein
VKERKKERKRLKTDILEEDFQNTTGLFIDETRNTLHTPTTSKTTNGRLCDT